MILYWSYKWWFKLLFVVVLWQGTQSFGGIRVGNGPTEDEAEIIQHDQLSQQYEEEPEVTKGYLYLWHQTCS